MQPVADYTTHSKLLRHPLSKEGLIIYGNANDQSVFGELKDEQSIWEPHIFHLFCKLIRPHFVCLDIGANIGCHTLVLGALASQGHVYAFEPVPSNYEPLRMSLQKNGLNNVTALKLGAGSKKEVRNVCEPEVLGGTCFVCDDDAPQPENKLRRVIHDLVKTEAEKNYVNNYEIKAKLTEVELVRLDEWYPTVGIERLDLIKMDVEGFEPAVLDGAREMIGRFRPMMVTEMNPACLQQYFGLSGKSLFELLQSLYPYIYVIDNDGKDGFTLAHCANYAQLDEWYAKRGWQELLCAFKESRDILPEQ